MATFLRLLYFFFHDLGGIPYQGCEDLGVIELINQIKKGYRLSKPEGTSDERFERSSIIS
jgi:hypothetical protein